MQRFLPRRAVAVVAACLCGAALHLTVTPWANAEGGDSVVSRDDIAKQLGFSRDRAIRPTADSPVETAPRVSLSAIQFEFNSDRLTAKARSQVAELAAALTLPTLKGFSFSVVGHTDSVGASEYNRDLSLRRARSVKRHLVAADVSAGRLVEVGLGEDYPVDGTAGDDARNRRVEVINLGTGTAAIGSAATRRRDTEQREGRALLIGIDRYQHVSPLIGTVNDVHAMKSYISSHLGFDDRDVRMLLDGEATRDNILSTIEDWLIAGTREGDDVFLYYSGHGFQQPDENDDEADRLDETLVPVDVTIGADGVPRGMIADDEVAALLAQLPGRRVHLVIDACHSGTSDRFAIMDTGVESWRYVKAPRGPDGAPLRIGTVGTDASAVTGQPIAQEGFVSTKDPGVNRLDITVWAAVRADQKALVDEELPSEPGSVFTRRLLWGARDGKADTNADGIVSRSELHTYLVRESEAYCERHPHRCGNGLTPQLHAEVGGMDRAAFSPGRAAASIAPNAAVAKDILVRQAERLVASSEQGVQLSIEPGTSLPVGSSVDIVVESDQDGNLVLLDIDPTGRMVQIFPNRFSERSGVSDRIRAGQVLRIPGAGGGFRFSVEPPIGEGMLLAVVTQQGLQLSGLVSRHKDLAVIERPGAYLVELHEALRAASGTDWGRATREYEVVAAR